MLNVEIQLANCLRHLEMESRFCLAIFLNADETSEDFERLVQKVDARVLARDQHLMDSGGGGGGVIGRSGSPPSIFGR